jgi:hypothetical protein
VFILGDSTGGRAGAERAAEVLSVGSRCRRHPPTGIETGPGAAAGARPGVDIARAVTGTSGKRHDDDTDTLVGTLREHVRPGSNTDHTILVGSQIDPHRDGATHGLAGRPHDRDDVAGALGGSKDRGGWRVGADEAAAGQLVYRKATKAHHADDWERWERADMSDTLDAEAMGAVQATAILGAGPVTRVDMLPLGLDSHRYRCCGNGVVSGVSEWIGYRLRELVEADL